MGSSIVGGVFEQEVFFSYKEGREYGFWRLLFFFNFFFTGRVRDRVLNARGQKLVYLFLYTV